MKPSLKRQLFLWLLIPIFEMWIVSTLLSLWFAAASVDNAYDNSLADSTKALASRLERQANGKYRLDLPPAAQAVLGEDFEDQLFYQILDANGQVIAGDRTLPAPPPQAKKLAFRNAEHDKNAIRIATLQVRPGGNSGVYRIQVAETLQGRHNLYRNILISMILPELIMIVFSVVILWLGIGKGLRPLDRIRKAVLERSPRDLTPIDEDHVPIEVRPLLHAINDLLTRLNAELERQRRFTANAAHQLRTPLSGLKTQLELMQRQTEPEQIRHSMEQTRISMERSIQLVQKLLTLAKSEPHEFQEDAFEPVNLQDVVKQTTAELVPLALKKGIDLGFEGLDNPPFILGNIAQLHDLSANLIENALFYTPREGTVTVRLVMAANTVSLVVEDTGPGIPDAEKTKVFERFYRSMDTPGDGSGLGLAIVQEVARNHQAEVTLSDGQNGLGTLVEVRFSKIA